MAFQHKHGSTVMFLGIVFGERSTVFSAVTNCHATYTLCRWLPLETKQSMNDYIRVLRNSDLTLNPAGKNVECYRIYEAMSLGSVPVVEDSTVAASCGTAASDGHRQLLRLLKQHQAPVIYISDWRELSAVLQRESQMSPADIVARRISVVHWYRKFRRKMRDSFVQVIHRKFFGG